MERPSWKGTITTVSENVKNVNKFKNVKPKLTFRQWLGKQLKEFCSVTALHGYGHVIRDDTALWERIFWGVTIFAAIITAIVLLWLSWIWNEETPTVTVIESTHYATFNIPFPAVTICNSNKISAAAAMKKANLMIRPSNISASELSDKFRLLYHFDGIGDATESQYNELHDILHMNNLSISNLIMEIAPTCNDMLQRCIWKGTQTRCEVLFQTIKTTMGYCCSFNYYGMNPHNYPPKLAHSIPTVPRRVTSCGYQTGLTVLLQPKINDYHTTVLGTFGFRVLIHDAFDFADDNAETKLISTKLEAFISLAPESTYSTDDVFSLPRKIRECVSPSEIKLNVLDQYSYVNCLAECRSSIIYQLCKCVPYSLPNNGSMPVCQMNQLSCVRENKIWYQGALPGINSTISKLDDIKKLPCGCFPDCQLLQYPSEVTSGVFNREYSFNSIGFFKDIPIDNQTLVNVFFKDLVSTYYRKDVYQNWLSVLASFGGLLGLFLGFSLVTGFELIYFFTLRVLFDKIAPKKIHPEK